MIPRKREHPPKMKQCKKEIYGDCQHGPNFCWYKRGDIHTENKDINMNQYEETKNIIIQLFIMMKYLS